MCRFLRIFVKLTLAQSRKKKEGFVYTKISIDPVISRCDYYFDVALRLLCLTCRILDKIILKNVFFFFFSIDSPFFRQSGGEENKLKKKSRTKRREPKRL